MHKNHLEAVQLTQKTAWALSSDDTAAVEVVVCPPFTALRSVGTLIDGDKLAIGLGAQDCHPEPQGAYTGEVSAPMLAKLGCGYVIVGHSERRQHFAERDELVSRKARAVLGGQMTPIVCVGESLEQREAGRTAEVVQGQVRGSLAGLGADQIGGLVIAYEPVWAIGTGRAAAAAEQRCAAQGPGTAWGLGAWPGAWGRPGAPAWRRPAAWRRPGPARPARLRRVTVS